MIVILIYHNAWRDCHHNGNNVLLAEEKDEADRILRSMSPGTHILLASFFCCLLHIYMPFSSTITRYRHLICIFHLFPSFPCRQVNIWFAALIQQIIIECLLYRKHSPRSWGYNRKQHKGLTHRGILRNEYKEDIYAKIFSNAFM